MSPPAPSWYHISNVHEVLSPSLLVYPDRVEENIRRMIGLAKGVERLRPHLKTHKMPELVRLQMDQGITRFKCATIAEAEMAATSGAPDLLLAYQPVGPNILRVLELIRRYPGTKFSVIVDDYAVVRELSEAAHRAGVVLEVFLDLDCGMHRCGRLPDHGAAELYQTITTLPALRARGFHAYDGHIHDHDPAARAARCETSFAPVLRLREQLTGTGMSVPAIVAGGTPTFPLHAERAAVECSPGTCVFWDHGYGTTLPDLPFLPAALVLTRVISKPAGDQLCLDLGHKAIASENPPPRVHFPELRDAQAVTHSEEHLVVKTVHAPTLAVGDPVYGIPWHICPTVALHAEAVAVRNGKAAESWKVIRDRRLNI